MNGPFVTSHQGIGDFMTVCEEFVRGLAACVHGRNERNPSVEIRSALTLIPPRVPPLLRIFASRIFICCFRKFFRTVFFLLGVSVLSSTPLGVVLRFSHIQKCFSCPALKSSYLARPLHLESLLLRISVPILLKFRLLIVAIRLHLPSNVW